MISKAKLWSIGKISIATLLLLTTSMRIAKAADPAAPSGVFADFPAVGGNSIRINWIDNTLDETKFIITVQKSDGVPQTFDVRAVRGTGTRMTSDLPNLAPGFYRYKVCAVQPTLPQGGTRLTCNPGTLSFITPPSAAPTNIRFDRINASTVRIFWNHPGGLDKFRVYITNNQRTLAAIAPSNLRNADIRIPLLPIMRYGLEVCSVSLAGAESCSPKVGLVFN